MQQGKYKITFRARKVTAPLEKITRPRAGFLKPNAHLFNLKLSKKRARKRFAFENKYLTVCTEGIKSLNE